MDWLYVLTGIAVLMATMTTIWFTITMHDRMLDKYYGNRDDDGDNGGIRH